MHRRAFLASMAGMALAPRLSAAQTPAPSPASGAGFAPVEVDGLALSLSPDGTMIAGTVDDDKIGIWDAQTLEPVVQSEPLDVISAIHPSSIAWAPDNSAIAFWPNTIAQFIDSDIYTLDVASGAFTNLTNEVDSPGATPASGLGQATADAPMYADTFPTWSPHNNRIAFARSSFGDGEKMGTDLCTVPREGGEVQTIATLSKDTPFLVSSTMFWDPDGSITYATWPPGLNSPGNGIFRVLNDGTIDPVSTGLLAADYPSPILFDVAPAAGLASVMSAVNFGMRLEPDWPGTYFLVDLTTGIPTRFEEILGLPVDVETARDQGLLLDAAPSIITGTAGADPQFVYVTSGRDTFTLFQHPLVGEASKIATFAMAENDVSRIRMPRIEIAENGTMLVLTWDGIWISR